VKLPDFELERYFARYEFKLPYLLSSSDVESHRMDELLALADPEARALWEELGLGYTQSEGHPLLRRAIASLYEKVEPDQILVFAGAEEAIFTFANVALDRGDHAIAIWPAYQSLYEVARASGADVTLLPLEHARGWQLDLHALRRAVRPTTRAIIVNFPHNPTGAMIDRETLEALVAIAADAGAVLFSDEVYRGIEYDPKDRLPGAADLDERAVSLGVMSKSFALPGLRIGWIASRDPVLLRRLAAFKDYLTICNSAPSEVLALIALRAKEVVLERSRAIVRSNLERADRFFRERADRFEWVRPRAGCIAFPKLLANSSIDDFARRLGEAEGVMLLPGSTYGHPGNHFRLGYGRRSFSVAIDRLERFAATLE
jgi:aspartate/methionine/tyrosine aminotransferase